MNSIRSFLFALILSMEVLMADGFIIIPRPPLPEHVPTPYPLEMRHHNVEVDIKDGIAITSVIQEFYNPAGSRLEGTYIFPVPERAVINSFAMEINGREVAAELLPADKARKIYEDIVRSMKDPALLEYAGRDVFKARVFPIEPHSTKKVAIKYVQHIKPESGMLNYIYPLNTEKFSSKPVRNVSVKINLEAKEKIKMLYCPSHDVEITRKGEKRAVIGFELSDALPDTDFSFYYSTDKREIGVDLLTYKVDEEDGFFIMNISPSEKIAGEELLQKNMVFVIDSSGSMAGNKMSQAKRALSFCIENLNKTDRFEVIRFSTEAESLFGTLKTATAHNISTAKNFVENMKPAGGTNIEQALSRAFSSIHEKDITPASIVFITDGKPTVGLTDEKELYELARKSNTERTRIFVFGIDYSIDTHLLDRIAQASAGYRTYVTPEEDLEVKLSSFYEKIRFPVFTDIRIDFGEIKVQDVYPWRLPDLFKNSQIVITGRYNSVGNTKITLRGTIAGGKKTFEYMTDFPERNSQNEFIPQIWAAQHVGYLLDEIRLNGENAELKDEIIETARKYGIVTPYTSFLIVEEEERRQTGGENPASMPLKNEISHDLSFLKMLEKEYGHMADREGMGSINASREIYSLQNAVNQKQLYQGRERLVYRDESGNTKNLTSQVKNIHGRAVYRSGNTWLDSAMQNTRTLNRQKVRFAGREYFELLAKEPASAQFLALGKNVKFVMNNIIYEICE